MKNSIYAIVVLLLLVTAGCKKEFFDINENPNSPTDQSITPNLILPRSLHATAARMANSYDYAAHWTGYWARSGTFGPNVIQESYNLTTSFQADEFAGWYDILTDVNLMEKKGLAANQKFYVGIAKIMKSIGFMYLVDQYGNVPYSKAFDLTGNILPTYDKGSDIYKDLLLQLDEATKLIAGADVGANIGIEEADIMFHGDKTMWRKLANTQRLKLLLRQSQIPGFSPAADIAKITADGSGFLGATQTASVQPSYIIDANKQNPFWDAYKFTNAGAVSDTYNRANNYVLDKLISSNDIRYEYYFSEARAVLGTNNYYGYNFGENLPNTDPFKEANSSDVAGPGLAKTATQAQWLFTSVESMFLQAEAIERGWLPGAPEAAYKSAVRESFIWLGVTDAVVTADEYLNQGTPLVTYDAAAAPADRVKFIVMQKYLGLVGINNFEAYTDYRRLGVPTDLPLSMSESRNANKIPVRILYPQNEYNYNATNVAAEGTISAQTSTVFWDK
ncbi:MAG: SusD/RagB family nutrient-binding outer membrane lipoprotein [Pyrinomonadaceae bacterium]|nr:SusD/RagB family nutrient-binding outer membrane lipoprotein [Sphingobacteriaceae bacterium]